GLFTIIVLGESIGAVVAGLEGIRWSWLGALTALLGLALAFSFWWVYFEGLDASAVRAALEAGRLAPYEVWIYAHLPLTAAIAAAGMGVRLTILHDTEAVLSPAVRWLVCSAAGLYFASLAAIYSAKAAAGSRRCTKAGARALWAGAAAILLVGALGTRLTPAGELALVAAVGRLLVTLDVAAPQARPARASRGPSSRTSMNCRRAERRAPRADAWACRAGPPTAWTRASAARSATRRLPGACRALAACCPPPQETREPVCVAAAQDRGEGEPAVPGQAAHELAADPRDVQPGAAGEPRRRGGLCAPPEEAVATFETDAHGFGGAVVAGEGEVLDPLAQSGLDRFAGALEVLLHRHGRAIEPLEPRIDPGQLDRLGPPRHVPVPERVGLEVDEGRVVHLPDLLPRAGPVCGPVASAVAVEVRRDEGHGQAGEFAQQREDDGAEVGGAVVETEHDGAWRGAAAPLEMVEQLVRGQRHVAVPLEEAQILAERIRLDGMVPEGGNVPGLRRPVGEDEGWKAAAYGSVQLRPVLLPTLAQEAHGAPGSAALPASRR